MGTRSLAILGIVLLPAYCQTPPVFRPEIQRVWDDDAMRQVELPLAARIPVRHVSSEFYYHQPDETRHRIDKAKDWLLRVEPADTEDAAFQLLRLHWGAIGSHELRGQHVRGRSAIEAKMQPSFTGPTFKDSVYAGKLRMVRLLRPDTASVDIDWEMTAARSADGSPRWARKGLLHWIRTWQTKAVVNEAFLRLGGNNSASFESRFHFFGEEFVAVDKTLERFADLDSPQAKIIDLRVIPISPASVLREWTVARAWPRRELTA